MPSNFAFLQPTHPTLYAAAVEAEALVYPSPRAACFHARFALERAAQWLYRHDPGLELPYDSNLGALLYEQTFKDNLPPGLFNKVRAIHKVGNHAAHDPRPLGERDSLQIVTELFHFLYWLARMYAPEGAEVPDQTFDRGLLPRPPAVQDLSVEQVEALEKRLAQSDEMARIEAERRAQTETELAALKAEFAALKAANQASADTHDYNEQETRDYFIDLLLKEAGWDPNDPNAVEFEVQGMPKKKSTSSGKGFVDYVLWGDDGLPLALVEAKRTRHSALKGQHQAKLYADCLEASYNQRPVIFCSNGYEHLIWDDQRYPPRPIHGFYTKAELERVHYRRTAAKRLSVVQPNVEIVGRPYQLEAIRRITETFDAQGRKALLVMATGTGKTRTAIALVDLLKRADWVKRVLFLADRNALLTQAKRAFTQHLPSAIAVDITEHKEGVDATVVLSTYATMLNRIDKREAGEAVFGPGHFDLVIVDEAHRSIYKKYAVLFDYFDSLLVGLTATPRDEVHRDTYRVFDLEPGVPTAFYELGEAVDDGFLVPPQGVSVPFKFLQQGIKYAELSDDDKEEYETKLRDDETGDHPDHVDAAALNKWLFNMDTVDQALDLLMEQGVQIDDGERLGKTIIFGRNHKHAEFIVERFNKAFPSYKGAFAQIIDSHNDYAQSLLDDFCTPAKQPTIAVSVDMLDTGVDVPECVNLVFFKPVRSRVKFNQMIGRGTRLCPDLFGPGQDKGCFLVFDLCGNIEFFEQQFKAADPKLPDSLSSRLVKTRLELVRQLPATDDERLVALRTDVLDHLHQHVATMTTDNFQVRKHRREVETFTERERWETLTDDDADTVAHVLAPLPNGLEPEPFQAKQFDVLLYRLMVALLHGSKSFIGYRDQVRDLADRLEETNVPMVKSQLPLIQAIQDEDYWTDITLPMVDEIRRKLRDLIQFIVRKARSPVYTDLPDSLLSSVAKDVGVPIYQTGFSPGQYRKKVQKIIRDNEGHVAIAKLRRNQALTEMDLEALEAMLFDPETVGTRAQFEQVFGKDLRLPRFIRQLVGLDRNAAKAAFGKYLAGSGFTANQVRFVETIIDFLTTNGVMDPGLLFEAPFTDGHPEGVEGMFGDEDVDNIIAIVRGFNERVGAEFGAAQQKKPTPA